MARAHGHRAFLDPRRAGRGPGPGHLLRGLHHFGRGGMKVLVVGAAVSGRAAVRLLEEQGEQVAVYDADPGALEGLEEGRRVHSGSFDPAWLQGVDLVVTSPGVPEHAPPLRAALEAGLTVWGELELASRHLTVPLLAVTGTNGKTTVTQMAVAMLHASGRRAAAVGNIGVPLADAVGADWEVLVVEASSFQLRFTSSFHPQAAVLLNVAPDHLDWHGDFDSYLAAKARIHRNQGPEDVLVYDADDAGARRAVSGARSRLLPVSGHRCPEGGAGPEGGGLLVGDGLVEVAAAADPIFLVDAAAAAGAALFLGATPTGVTAALADFRPPHHRREVVGVWDGVTWVDDSKATNPHAAVAAIRSCGPVVLIAGGRNKGLDVAAISAEPSLRHVIGIGEAGPEMVAAARAGTLVGGMDEAVALADRLAEPGDTVLLAPGCASFDMFHSYAHRGEVFAVAVRRLKEGR
ncbi:MAG: UDP-N-acetylmuramoyl-L-alanine--D-glutamate ligase [Acidimicrobiia bacterium]|nr:UDP-N-acetylmuramoyl-L-alanine--D-glutamate ligase [Acidimicrobiia bacterium]